MIISSFSGGETSAYMAKYLIDNSKEKVKFIFANTSKEHEKTLGFVNRCHKEWNLDLTWIEAVVHDGRVGCTHKVVTYETAKRNGEVFEEVIKKYGIPNKAFLHCNRELKINPIKSWIKSIGGENFDYAIGIRCDEFDRMSPDAEKRNIIYPLINQTYTTKGTVKEFWRNQPFGLGLSEHLGNCVTCYKKSDRKLLTIAKDEPERFEFFDRMEQKYSNIKGDERLFFRGNRTVRDLVGQAQKRDFIPFKEIKPEYQPDLFGLDQSSGCSETCEAFVK